MSKPEIVICNPVRTAIGTYNGSLKSIAWHKSDFAHMEQSNGY